MALALELCTITWNWSCQAQHLSIQAGTLWIGMQFGAIDVFGCSGESGVCDFECQSQELVISSWWLFSDWPEVNMVGNGIGLQNTAGRNPWTRPTLWTWRSLAQKKKPTRFVLWTWFEIFLRSVLCLRNLFQHNRTKLFPEKGLAGIHHHSTKEQFPFESADWAPICKHLGRAKTIKCPCRYHCHLTSTSVCENRFRCGFFTAPPLRPVPLILRGDATGILGKAVTPDSNLTKLQYSSSCEIRWMFVKASFCAFIVSEWYLLAETWE